MAEDRENELMENEQPENGQDPVVSEKSRKLMEKVNELAQRIEEEKNPIKRHLLSFKVKMVLSKIQREIDLQNIKEAYDDIREFNAKDRGRREDKYVDDIARLNTQIKRLKRELKGNEEYDAESKHFLYPKGYVNQVGGVDNLVEKLKESNKPRTQQTAQKIEEMAEKRDKLNRLQDRLKNAQNQLKNSKGTYTRENIQLNVEEKALTVKKRFNIFDRIKQAFKNGLEEIQEFRKERAELKGLKDEQGKEFDELDEKYDEEMRKLKEEYEKQKEAIKEKMQEEKRQKQSQIGKDKAQEFRDRISEMTQEGEEEPVAQGGEPVKEEDKEPVVEEGQKEYEAATTRKILTELNEEATRKILIEKGYIKPNDDGMEH